MRSLYIPAAVLAAILGFALWTGYYATIRTDHWTDQLEAVEEAAQREDWQQAEALLRRTYQDWDRSQTFYHTIMEHDQLDEAEEYFAGSFAACRQRDDEEFQILLSQLMSKLRLLAETQSVSIKNIL